MRVHERPNRNDAAREHHRLEEHPHEADVVTAVARDDLAHDQCPDDTGLDHDRTQQVGLRASKAVRHSECSLTAVTIREVTAQRMRLTNKVAAMSLSVLGSIGTSGLLGSSIRSM